MDIAVALLMLIKAEGEHACTHFSVHLTTQVTENEIIALKEAGVDGVVIGVSTEKEP